MARKEVLETEVNTELSFARCGAVIIQWPAANQLQWLWPLFPFQRFTLECPQIPLRFHDVGGVFVNVLRRDCRHFRRTKRSFAKIPFRDRSLGGVDSLYD